MAIEGNTVLSVGVIGTGDIVRSAHLPVLLARPDVRVDWVTDLSTTQAQSIGRAYQVNVAPLPKDLHQLPAADVVLLTAPYGVRDPYYEALREREVAIYPEKPIACSSGYHRKLCGWFPNYALASGLMMRCWAPNAMMQTIITSEMFGRLREVRFGFGRPGLVTHGRYYLDRKKGGGGMLWEMAIHGIDTLLHVASVAHADVENVTAVHDGDIELHTHAITRLTTSGGHSVRGEITVTGIENIEEGVAFEFDQATLSYPLPGQGYALVGDSVNSAIRVLPRKGGITCGLNSHNSSLYPMTKFQMFDEYWSAFLNGVRTRKANWSSGIASTVTTDLIDELDRATVGAADRSAA